MRTEEMGENKIGSHGEGVEAPQDRLVKVAVSVRAHRSNNVSTPTGYRGGTSIERRRALGIDNPAYPEAIHGAGLGETGRR